MTTKKTILALGIVAAFAAPVEATINRAAGGDYHTLYIGANDKAYGIGRSGHGQIGPNYEADKQKIPVYVGVSNVRTVAACGFRSIVLSNAGTAYFFGKNYLGQSIEEPQPIDFPGKVIDVSVTMTKAHALIAEGSYTIGDTVIEYGSVYEWNFNEGSDPVQVVGLSEIVSISSGADFTLALKRDSTVYSWGGNEYGQLGNGSTTSQSTPSTTPILSGANYISAGEKHSMAVMTDGSVKTWGYGSQGRLGNGSTDNQSLPVDVNISDIVRISGGRNQTIAVTSTGQVYAWGWHNYIGGSSYNFAYTPELVNTAGEIIDSAAGGSFTVLIDRTGQPISWGGNLDGQLGLGHTTETHQPEQMLPPVWKAPVVAAVAEEVTEEPIIDVAVIEPAEEPEVSQPTGTTRKVKPGHGYGDKNHKHKHKHKNKAPKKSKSSHNKHKKSGKSHSKYRNSYKGVKPGHGYGDKNHKHRHKNKAPKKSAADIQRARDSWREFANRATLREFNHIKTRMNFMKTEGTRAERYKARKWLMGAAKCNTIEQKKAHLAKQ